MGSEPLLLAANEWRAFIRMGDQFLDAVEKVSDASIAASEAEDEITARRANADVGASLRRVVMVTGKAYGHFASGRQALYEYAKLFDIPTKRSGGAFKAKSPADIRTISDDDLRKEIQKGADGLSTGIRKMLDLGARAQKDFRDGAVFVVQGDNELPEELAKPLVEEGLDFRDAVSVNVFARTNGVMRRTALLSKRAWELMMMEDKSGWTAPWAHDPEIGNLEII